MTLLKRAFLCVGVLATLSACEHGDPVSVAGGELGKAVQISGAETSPVTGRLPGGSATVSLIFGSLDPNVRDALGRKQADPTRARRTRNFRSTAEYWTWTNEIRDGSEPNRDPRLPVPQGNGVTGYLELYQPHGAYPNAEYWEFYVELYDLAPNTTHEVAFVHRRLTVNGEVDHVQRIMNGTVTQPDQLTITSGTRAAINTDWTGTAPVGCADYPGPTANPFVIGTGLTDAAGTITTTPTKKYLDKCWKANNGIWTKAEFDTQSKSMVGRADDQTYALPNYNYIEVWQGAFGTGTLVARVQIAQDLDPAGAPVKDAYPPFPAPGGMSNEAQQGPIPAVDAAASYPISNALKSTLPGALVVPSTVTATLNNVQRLETGVYKAWFMNGLTGAASPASGTYVRTLYGSTVETVSNTSTFAGGPGTITFTTTYDPAVHGAFADSLNFLVFSKETDAAATTPSISQPLWVKIFKFPPASAGGATTFGNFNRDSLPAGGNPARMPVPFTPQGVASGGVIGDTVTMTVPLNDTTARGPVFVGSLIEIRFTGLQRPPKGYEYAAFLRRASDGTVVHIGGLRSPDGSSLANADVAPSGGNLGPNGIRVGLLKYDIRLIPGTTLCDYDKIQLYVVPKGGALYEPAAMVFNISMPARVTTDAIACK